MLTKTLIGTFLLILSCFSNIKNRCVDGYKGRNEAFLLEYAQVGEVEKARNLIKNEKVDINFKNEEGLTFLHHAIENMQFEMVQLLIEEGIDVNKSDNYGKSPLHYAAWRGNEKILKLNFSEFF